MTDRPVLLGLEASTGPCSVALLQGDEVLGRLETEGRASTGRLIDMLDALLAESGVTRSAIDAVVAGRGPGGFTGVRITMGVAQGLALGLDRPAIAVSTLHVLAETALASVPGMASSGVGPQAVLAVLDARMGEVYAGHFHCQADGPGRTRAQGAESLQRPECVAPVTVPCYLAGSGVDAYPALQALAGGHVLSGVVPDIATVMPLARARFEAGEGVPGAHLQPVYLRDRVVDQPK